MPTTPVVSLTIGGTQYALTRPSPTQHIGCDGLTITAVADGPTTCSFTAYGFIPTVGQDVIILLGSLRIFAGPIMTPVQSYLGKRPANYQVVVNASDYTVLLNKRKVIKKYTAQSATTIAQDLISTYCTGFTSVNVAAALATIDEITFTNEDVTSALTRLAKRIGGYWYLDYTKDLHFFLTETGSDPTDLTSTHTSLTDFTSTNDLSQVVTRVYVEGGGVNAFASTAVGSTTLPVEISTWYPSSGTVVCGAQRITYTAIGGGYVPPIIDQKLPTATAAVNWERVVWAPSLGMFVAVAANAAATTVMTSFDGVTWTSRTPATNDSWSGLAWSPSLSLFVAVSTSGTIMTSPDGITWTGRTSPEANQWTAVCWAASINLFVMVSNTGTHRVQTSPDGVTWTSRTAASASAWQDVEWCPGLTLFVACHSTGGTSGVMTSPDGTTWTSQTTAAATWQGVAWSTALGMAVVVGANAITTSTNGTVWTSRTAPSANNWRRVIWIQELGVFVGISSDGAGTSVRRAMSSADGITWVDYSTPTVGAWWGIAWSPTLSMIVIVGVAGGAAIMTSTVIQYRTLTGIPPSGAGSILYAILQGDPVNLLAQVDDASAQTALAALVGGDGVQEDYIQDNRLSYTEAVARGTAWLTLRKSVEVSVGYHCRDPLTRPGRNIHVNLGAPTSVTGDFKIQHVTISTFPANSVVYPDFAVTASSTRFSLEDLLRRVRDLAA